MRKLILLCLVGLFFTLQTTQSSAQGGEDQYPLMWKYQTQREHTTPDTSPDTRRAKPQAIELSDHSLLITECDFNDDNYSVENKSRLLRLVKTSSGVQEHVFFFSSEKGQRFDDVSTLALNNGFVLMFRMVDLDVNTGFAGDTTLIICCDNDEKILWQKKLPVSYFGVGSKMYFDPYMNRIIITARNIFPVLGKYAGIYALDMEGNLVKEVRWGEYRMSNVLLVVSSDRYTLGYTDTRVLLASVGRIRAIDKVGTLIFDTTSGFENPGWLGLCSEDDSYRMLGFVSNNFDLKKIDSKGNLVKNTPLVLSEAQNTTVISSSKGLIFAGYKTLPNDKSIIPFLQGVTYNGEFLWRKMQGMQPGPFNSAIGLSDDGILTVGYNEKGFLLINKYGGINTGIRKSSDVKNPLIVYPNPCVSEVNFKLPSFQIPVKMSISINDLTGRTVFQTTSLSGSEIKINSGFLKSGQYIVQVKNDQTILTKKFIKM